jgi:hypothetical protein
MRLSLQPLANDASALLAILRPVFRETIIHYVVALDAKRVLDDPGGAVAVVTLDGLVMGTPHKIFCRQVIASGSRSPARLRGRALTGSFSALDRRTWYRPVRTEYATVARLWF